MITSALLCTLFASACVSGQAAAKSSPFVCRMNALSAEERAELPRILDRLLASHPKAEELPNGYEIRFRAGANLFPMTVKWLAAESRCCPFFAISVSQASDDGVMVVRLEGPPGVKEFIAADLPRIQALARSR